MTGAGGGRSLVRTLHWRRLDTPGSEHFSLWRTERGWDLIGIVVVTLEGRPVLAEYTVRCADDWTTEEVEAQTTSGEKIRRLRLQVRDGRWSNEQGELGDLEGATDVDLGVTPSTNTLPIRRLGLGLGDRADLEVAWVRFPDLEVVRSEQRYSRLSESTYRYESGSFQRDIEVDELGLVTTYPGLFVCESVLTP